MDQKTDKKIEKKCVFFEIVKSTASGKENVQFPDSPDFENFPDFQTRHDVR